MKKPRPPEPTTPAIHHHAPHPTQYFGAHVTPILLIWGQSPKQTENLWEPQPWAMCCTPREDVLPRESPSPGVHSPQLLVSQVVLARLDLPPVLGVREARDSPALLGRPHPRWGQGILALHELLAAMGPRRIRRHWEGEENGAKGEGGARRRKGRMASCPQGKEGRGSPVPWVLALPTGPAEGARSKSGGTPEHLPDSPITLPCPAHLLPFLTREAGHPRVTLQKENLVSNAIVAITMKGAWSAGVYRPDATGTRRPRCPTPDCRTGLWELTTPPRGPVFPGEPWKKKLGHSEMSSPGKRAPPPSSLFLLV